ncbi:hypothetical protein BDV96DRAFT_137377 [Lophiotrema nucula]|uniref:RING-type domain-containing protein n=1 Tax=Lophiotrema nucula TaxID=690887 RepID=A0A6A5ZTG5_9PLEO|nr:hypothetical protein BDV96DRAFT_137377 [Lophiotrema nucula]
MPGLANAVTSGWVQNKPKLKVLGRAFTQLHVGAKETVFSAHADLLCSRSNFFKERLQPSRKTVEGDCAICLVKMDPIKDDITYCTSCGQNFHGKCMTQWLGNNNTTCTTCRAVWVGKPSHSQLKCADLDADSFELYIQWLYNDQLSICQDEHDANWIFQLLQAHIAGDTLGDIEFQKAILAELIEHHMTRRSYPGETYVQHVYENTSGPCTLRRFLVDMYVYGVRELSEDKMPVQFLLDLSKALLKYRPADRPDINIALADYIKSDDNDT